MIMIIIMMTIGHQVLTCLGRHDHGQLRCAVRGGLGSSLVIIITIITSIIIIFVIISLSSSMSSSLSSLGDSVQLTGDHLCYQFHLNACYHQSYLVLKTRYTDFLGLPGTLDRVQEMVTTNKIQVTV